MNTTLTINDLIAKAKKAATPTLRGRMIFALDATASRAATWTLAQSLQRGMLEATAAIGTLDVSLAYFRGEHRDNDVGFSDFSSDPNSLIALMDGIDCRAGQTQIIPLLNHALTLNAVTPVNAMVFIGDTMEEETGLAYAASKAVGDSNMKLFIFHERSTWGTFNHQAELKEMARLGNGAYAPFSEASASELAALLRAVAAFATGGMKALMKQDSAAAKLLLTQLKS